MPSLPHDFSNTSVTLRKPCSWGEGGGVDTKVEVDLLVHSFPGLSSRPTQHTVDLQPFCYVRAMVVSKPCVCFSVHVRAG